MIRNDIYIQNIVHGDAIALLAEQKNISLQEARQELSKMNFKEYYAFITEAGAAIVPPSGNAIGSSAAAQKPPVATTGPSQVKSIWPGAGAPVEVGMTVGVKDATGKQVPGQISHIDAAANGAKVKNPVTGKDEWVNTDQLEPFIAQQGTAGQTDLQRLQELAGIKEDGGTSAGSVAVFPAPLGRLKKRESTEEALKKEYTPREPAKTIVGDTKPLQASGELSATLAANGKKTASRTNNGFKR